MVDRAGKQLRPTGRWLHLNVAGEDGVTLIGNYHDWLAVAVYVEPLHGVTTPTAVLSSWATCGTSG